MKIKVSEHVNEEGRIFLPYLNEWRFPAYDTVGLLGVSFFKETKIKFYDSSLFFLIYRF